MIHQQVRCPQCRQAFHTDMFNLDSPAGCPSCRIQTRVRAFPALFGALPRGRSPEPVVTDGEASCYFHERHRAVLPCDQCGRFLCALCDIELGQRHLCPRCLEAEYKQESNVEMVRRRTQYDRLALGLATWPLLLLYLTIVTAPMALYLAIRYWKVPGSILPQTRALSMLAVLIALAEIGGWVFLCYALATDII